MSSTHQSTDAFDDGPPMGLAVAYAGALVLVDGARYLREHVHSNPVVRKKLNEPEPHFGIPHGTYDRVQKSLTSPVHAWHLYHAVKAIRHHWRDIEMASRGVPELESVVEIILRLQHRLDISLEQFVVARTRARARSIRTRLTRDVIRRGLYGLQKHVSSLMSEKYVRAGHRPQLPPTTYARLQSHLRPGDVIVTRKEYAITNYFLPGYWPHVALFVGTVDEFQAAGWDQHDNIRRHWPLITNLDTAPHRVLEALKDGVRIRSLASPFSSDAVAVLRPRIASSHIAKAIHRGFFHADKPYDFDFDFTRSDRMVCTEVVYRAYEGIGDLHFELTRRAGRMTLSAEDLINKALRQDGFEVSCVYAPSLSLEVRVERTSLRANQEDVRAQQSGRHRRS